MKESIWKCKTHSCDRKKVLKLYHPRRKLEKDSGGQLKIWICSLSVSRRWRWDFCGSLFCFKDHYFWQSKGHIEKEALALAWVRDFSILFWKPLNVGDGSQAVVTDPWFQAVAQEIENPPRTILFIPQRSWLLQRMAFKGYDQELAEEVEVQVMYSGIRWTIDRYSQVSERRSFAKASQVLCRRMAGLLKMVAEGKQYSFIRDELRANEVLLLFSRKWKEILHAEHSKMSSQGKNICYWRRYLLAKDGWHEPLCHLSPHRPWQKVAMDLFKINGKQL